MSSVMFGVDTQEFLLRVDMFKQALALSANMGSDRIAAQAQMLLLDSTVGYGPHLGSSRLGSGLPGNAPKGSPHWVIDTTPGVAPMLASVNIMSNDQAVVDYEFGTRPHKIRARNRRALHWTQGGASAFAKSVNHPGTKGHARLADFANQVETVAVSEWTASILAVLASL